MSVNLTMDGNTYEGATKITVGGKTININEASTGETSGDVVYGTFNGDGSRNLNLDTGKIDATFIAIHRKDLYDGEITFGSARTIISLYFYNGIGYVTGSQENSSAQTNLGFASGVNESNNNITNGVVKLTSLTAGGVATTFKDGDEYKWMAW